MDGFTTWTLKVPGRFADRSGAALLDIETRKVPVEGGYEMPNGEVLKTRWEAFLIGIAVGGEIVLVEGPEPLAGAAEVLAGVRTVVYGATREFDEMILRGRFTNARRAHAPEPFYPALDGAEEIEWVNVGPTPPAIKPKRSATDVKGRDVSATWDGRGREPDSAAVMIHNLRDLAELILTSAAPDRECAEWCERVLLDDAFANGQIFGPEE